MNFYRMFQIHDLLLPKSVKICLEVLQFKDFEFVQNVQNQNCACISASVGKLDLAMKDIFFFVIVMLFYKL